MREARTTFSHSSMAPRSMGKHGPHIGMTSGAPQDHIVYDTDTHNSTVHKSSVRCNHAQDTLEDIA
jgi:hypothetical protein